VIVSNGVTVFWPKKVVEFELKPGSGFEVAGASVLAGEVSDRRKKAESDVPETKYFLGNRDIYGLSFKFIDDDAIAETSTPDDLLVIERMEYGRAIGHPVSITDTKGAVTKADATGFDNALELLAESAQAAREEIEEIRRKKVGKISRELEKLELREIDLRKDYADDPTGLAEKMAPIEKSRAQLQTESDAFAAEAAEKEVELNTANFTYRLPSGEEKTLPAGGFIDAYYANQLGFGEKLGRFFHNIWNFLSQNPREANTEGGVFPAIFGTFLMTILMSVLVTPLGVLAAIYLREYARQGPLVRSVRIAVNNLAGVPSIVFGVFGLGFFIYIVGGGIDEFFFSTRLEAGKPTFGTGGLLWASATLALMTIPVVIVATEEAISAVPRGAKEASLACGASKWQTIQRIVLPASLPGIITGLVLAVARGAGEVAPLMLVGVVKQAEELPISTTFPFGADQKFMHLGFHIYDLGFQSPDSEAAQPMVFATTLLLILLVVVLNLGAILLRERVRRRLATNVF
jgi:phosphate transport system permease protein